MRTVAAVKALFRTLVAQKDPTAAGAIIEIALGIARTGLLFIAEDAVPAVADIVPEL